MFVMPFFSAFSLSFPLSITFLVVNDLMVPLLLVFPFFVRFSLPVSRIFGVFSKTLDLDGDYQSVFI